ncbi:hypothetical protein EB118_02140 [bacterium]|nr:hypothetical protein [bacterium]NDC93911.1 hypothetical protein [bacterium]NDD83256.1 hypothetical protein [bacterium]NDG28888.1 hypothetical protein [bacterium]
MEKLPIELKFDVIKNVDIFDLHKVCKLDKSWREFCKANKTPLMKMYLRKHNQRFSDDSIDASFRFLIRRLKESRFYNNEFPKIVLNISKEQQPSSNLIRSYLNRQPTKYELMVIKEAMNGYNYSEEDIKHLVRRHIYRFGETALGNPMLL